MNIKSDANSIELTDEDIMDSTDWDNNYWFGFDPNGDHIEEVSQDFLNGLSKLHRFVDKVRNSDKAAYDFSWTARGERAPIRRLGPIPPCLVTPEFRSTYQLSEQVKAFLECYDQLPVQLGAAHLRTGRFDGELMADIANELVERIRSKTLSAEFSQALAHRVGRREENFRNGKALIDSLFAAYERLNVVRVDLEYGRHAPASLQQAKKDLTDLLNKGRSNRIFKNALACIWRLEYTLDTGYHFHVIFFFDGSKRSHDGLIAAQIGAYWIRTITKGRGRYQNCNFSKNRYKTICIGTIKRREVAKRYFLIHIALQYLTKVDELVGPPGGVRAFGMSRMQEPSGLGRKWADDGLEAALATVGTVGSELFEQLPKWAQERVRWRAKHSRKRRTAKDRAKLKLGRVRPGQISKS